MDICGNGTRSTISHHILGFKCRHISNTGRSAISLWYSFANEYYACHKTTWTKQLHLAYQSSILRVCFRILKAYERGYGASCRFRSWNKSVIGIFANGFFLEGVHFEQILRGFLQILERKGRVFCQLNAEKISTNYRYSISSSFNARFFPLKNYMHLLKNVGGAPVSICSVAGKHHVFE